MHLKQSCTLLMQSILMGTGVKIRQGQDLKSRFHSGGGSLQDVMMMSREGRIQYGQGEDFIAVRLPYGKENTAMYCVLPKGELPINDFIEGLDGEKWEAIRESIAERNDVKLNLPASKWSTELRALRKA